MIKALFFDIDGTTYLHSKHECPKSTLKALKLLREKGYKLAICTSRTIAEFVNLQKEYLDCFDAIICAAGAQVYIDHELVINHKLDQNDVDRVIPILDKYKLVYRWSTTDNQNQLSVDDETIKNRFYGFYKYIPEVKKYNGEELNHILYYCDDENINQEIIDASSNSNHIKMSIACELTAKGIHKGTAILECAKQWGIQPNETAAFGDALNDLPMIEMAGIGIAMGNAVEGLKEVANYITTSIEEDGIYNACQHFNWI